MALYTFLVRAYNYDDDVLGEVAGFLLETTSKPLEQLHGDFYFHFQEGFCVKVQEKCVPNVHAFYHLLKSRRWSGPLWKTSAEPFESIYAILKRSSQAGTPNTPKQCLENFYLRDT